MKETARQLARRRDGESRSGRNSPNCREMTPAEFAYNDVTILWTVHVSNLDWMVPSHFVIAQLLLLVGTDALVRDGRARSGRRARLQVRIRVD